MLTYDMDGRGEESLYVYLYRCVRADIESGTIAPGERLPSKRSLARHLGVSVITVEGAYAQLLAEGYIHARERCGYFASTLPDRPPAVALSKPDAVRAPRTERRRAPSPGTPEFDFTDAALGNLDDTAALWGRAVKAALNEEPSEELFADLPAAGHPRLRRAIAGHLRAFRGMEVDPERIVVGAGAQLFYALLAQMLGSGTRIAVEDPGFSRIAKAYAAAGLSVRTVALDGQGVSMEGLARSRAQAVHVMPSHQFPSGVVMSAARRYELLGWAACEPDRLVVEDDYDCEFRLSGRPVPALASIDTQGKVAYLNTFSKSLSSALRMAYLVLAPELAQRFSDEFGFYACTVSALDQIVLARLIESGAYERHINRVRTRHRAVRDELLSALRSSGLAERLRFHGLDAGLHFVLEVEGCDAERVARELRGHGIALAPLRTYCACAENCGSAGSRFVVQYGSMTPRAARKAAERLAGVLDAMCYSSGTV